MAKKRKMNGIDVVRWSLGLRRRRRIMVLADLEGNLLCSYTLYAGSARWDNPLKGGRREYHRLGLDSTIADWIWWSHLTDWTSALCGRAQGWACRAATLYQKMADAQRRFNRKRLGARWT